jgi:hypothetical protein
MEKNFKKLDRYATKLDYATFFNPANMYIAYLSAGDRITAEIDQIQNVLQIAQWRQLALDFLSTMQLQSLYTTLLAKLTNY